LIDLLQSELRLPPALAMESNLEGLGVSGGNSGEEAVVMTAAQYSESVYQWLLQAHQWHSLAAGFPAYMAYQTSILRQQQQQQLAAQVSSWNTAAAAAANRYSSAATAAAAAAAAANNAGNQAAAAAAATTAVWREFKIASLWKRFAAEAIDFVILFILKLVVTLVAVDYFGLLDMSKYDRSMLLAATANGDLDFLSAMEATSDILLLETIHKLLVCVFEALCTHRGTRSKPGGATPGKVIMGIRIYQFDQIASTAEQGVVQIAPAADLGLYRASIRSIVKNIASTFIMPSWLTIFLSPYYRAIHDVLSKTIVLEVPVGDNARGPAILNPAAEDNNNNHPHQD